MKYKHALHSKTFLQTFYLHFCFAHSRARDRAYAAETRRSKNIYVVVHNASLATRWYHAHMHNVWHSLRQTVRKAQHTVALVSYRPPLKQHSSNESFFNISIMHWIVERMDDVGVLDLVCTNYSVVAIKNLHILIVLTVEKSRMGSYFCSLFSNYNYNYMFILKWFNFNFWEGKCFSCGICSLTESIADIQM